MEWLRPFPSFTSTVGLPYLFGIDQDEVGQYLSDRGLTLADDVGAAKY